jgi:hypothetical protein
MLFSQQFLERIYLKHALGQEPFEPSILRDAIRATDRPNRLLALFSLLQDLDNLFSGVLTRFHVRPPVGGLYHSFLASLLGHHMRTDDG